MLSGKSYNMTDLLDLLHTQPHTLHVVHATEKKCSRKTAECNVEKNNNKRTVLSVNAYSRRNVESFINY